MGKISNLNNNRLQTSPVTGETVKREPTTATAPQPAQQEPPPRPTQSVTVQIDAEDHAALMMRRVRGHGPIKEQIKKAIRAYLEEKKA